MGLSTPFKFTSDIVCLIILMIFLGTGLRGQDIIFTDEDNFNIKDSDCVIPNGDTGQCVEIQDCPILLALITKPNQREFLKQANCGWNKSVSKVCCNKSWNCITPNNEPGRCVKLTSCPRIKAMITNITVSKETIAYIENCRCGSEKLDVCCSSTPFKFSTEIKEVSSILEDKKVGSCQMTSVPPEPGSRCCGLDTSANRIIGGEATSIDQYPWAAAIEYAQRNLIRVKCGGTLISGTYVVTAAHCMLIIDWTAINVRLGDYDIDHSGVDCTVVEGGAEDCIDEPVIIAIEKTILHPAYNINSPGQKEINDIALIKLQNAAPYTDFIRPICLPTTDFMETMANTVELRVTGWGVSNEIERYSPIKRHVKLPFVGRERCLHMYKLQNINLGEGQICAGGENGKDSCKGDSGGALMLIKDAWTEIVGVVSFGFRPCGLKNKPGIYTKIHNYLPWIKRITS